MDQNIYDSIVVGLGGHGTAALAQIAAKGHKVLGLEKFHRGHALGSSHGRSRIIRLAYYEEPRYVPFLKRSYELWRELAAFEFEKHPEFTNSTNESLLNMTGGLMLGKPHSVLITGPTRSAKAHNLQYELLTAAEIRSRFPAFNPADDEVGIYEQEAGYLVPERCLEAYLELAERHGAEIRHNASVSRWEVIPASSPENSTDRELIRVFLASGEVYLTRKLILTVGAWAPELYGSCLPPSVNLTLSRRVLHWFQPKPDPLGPSSHPTDIFKRIPIYIWDLDGPGNFYGFPESPTLPGQVKIASHWLSAQGAETSNTPTLRSPEELDRTVQPEEVENMRRIFREKMPLLDGELMSSAVCMYTLTPDENFLIDLHPSSSSVILASPCSGHGFKFCSVIGEILSELAVEGHSKHDLSFFSVDRVSQPQSTPTPPLNSSSSCSDSLVLLPPSSIHHITTTTTHLPLSRL